MKCCMLTTIFFIISKKAVDEIINKYNNNYEWINKIDEINDMYKKIAQKNNIIYILISGLVFGFLHLILYSSVIVIKNFSKSFTLTSNSLKT